MFVAYVIFFVAGYLIRIFIVSIESFDFSSKTSTNIDYALKTKKNAKYIAVPTSYKISLNIERETILHRFFKAFGFKRECKTGDDNFDNEFYVGCDSPVVNHMLKHDINSRELISTLFQKHLNVNCLGFMDNVLYVKNFGEVKDVDGIAELIHQFKVRMDSCIGITTTKDLNTFPSSTMTLMDCLIYGLFGLSVVFLFDSIMQSTAKYQSTLTVVFFGTIIGILSSGVGLFLISKLFSGSSRILQILKQSFILILFGSVFGGAKMFVELNQGLDTSEVSIKVITITKKQIFMRQYPGRGNGGPKPIPQWYYQEPKEAYPRVLELAPKIYETANVGDKVEIKSRSGFFNYSYRISINNIEL